MTPPKKEVRPLYLVIWMLGGLVLGSIVAGLACFAQPKIFESTAVVEVKEQPGRTVALSQVHAAQVVRLFRLDEKWGVSNREAVGSLCKNVILSARADGVEILVRHTDPEDARDIALGVSKVFKSMDAEAALAGKAPNLTPLTPEEEKAASDYLTLIGMLQEEAERAGVEDFRSVEKEALSGAVNARKVWESEDFQRRWTALGEFSGRAGWLEEMFGSAPLRLVVKPEIAMDVSSPNVSAYLFSGRIIGILVGGAIGLFRELTISRRPPRIPNPQQSVRGRPPTSPAPPNRDIEEEW